jgi:DNA-binding MarR family transcriptional regulator
MLEIIFDYYNISYGYAFPPYETLMSDLKTKRKAKVSKLLKSLVKKGYILITKRGKNNTYKLLKYLFIHNNGEGVAPEEEPIEITEEEEKVIELGFTHKEAKGLLKVAKDKIDKVVQAFEYAAQKGADNLYGYTVWALNNISKIKNTFKTMQPVEDEEGWHPKTRFDNFKPREYDYDWLEKKLLGW